MRTDPPRHEPVRVVALDLEGPGPSLEVRRRAWVVTRDSPAWRLLVAVAAALAVVAILLPTFLLPVIEARLVTRFVAIAVALLGLQFVVGVSGQLSLCHGVFVGIGSYTTTIAVSSAGWPHLIGLALTPVTGFLAGCLVGLLALRIRATYLGPVTLGVAVAFPMIVKRFGWITGGGSGMPLLRPMQQPPPFDTLRVHQWNHLVVVAVGVVALVIARNLARLRSGLAVRAAADNHISAASSGVNVRRVRVVAFGIGAAFGSIGGGLLVLDTPIVGADSYDLFRSLSYYAAVMVGGPASMLGAVLGAALLVGVPWLIDGYGLLVSPNLVFGLLLLGSVTVSPGGLAVAVRHAIERVLVVDEPVPDPPAHRAQLGQNREPG